MKLLKSISLGIAIIAAAGCQSSFYHKPLNYSADKNGWLIIYCANPPGQTRVIRHIVRIDGHETFEVAAKGQVPVCLNAGQHTMHFLSVGSLNDSHAYPGYNVFHDIFFIYGLSCEKEITVLPGKRREIKYIAPFWNYEAGTIKILK